MELSRWVCFLLLLPSAVASRTSGEVLLYEFGQSDCKASLFPSTGTVSDLSLTMDPTLVSCINGAVGVESLLDNTHAGPRRK